MATRSEVLARYGLAQCSMTTIGAEKTPEFPLWRVKITCDGRGSPAFFEVGHARRLAEELRHIGETELAHRIDLAIEIAVQNTRQRM